MASCRPVTAPSNESKGDYESVGAVQFNTTPSTNV
jgi:hypothetical protein